MKIQHLLSALVYHSKKMAVLCSLAAKQKRFMAHSLLQKAGNFFEKKLYEKSLYLYIAVYGLFVLVEVEETKKNSGTEESTQNNSNSLYNDLTFIKDCVSCRLNITENFNDDSLHTKITNSLTYFSLLGMVKCFNNMFNFKEARDCLEEAEKIEPENSYLAFLSSQNLSFHSSLRLGSLAKAKSLLRKSKLLFDAESLFKNQESLLRQFQLNNFSRSLTRHHKYILKKKKALEKKIKQKTSELCQNSLSLYKSGSHSENLFKELNGKVKGINFIVSFVQARFLQNLRYYRQNKNSQHYNRIRKEYYGFKLFKDELDFIRRTEVDVRVVNVDLRNELKSILDDKTAKEKLLRCFETEKLKQIIEMNQKFQEEENLTEKQKFNEKSSTVLNELRKQYNAKRRRKGEREGFNMTLADCSFLVTFVILIAKLTDLITEI